MLQLDPGWVRVVLRAAETPGDCHVQTGDPRLGKPVGEPFVLGVNPDRQLPVALLPLVDPDGEDTGVDCLLFVLAAKEGGRARRNFVGLLRNRAYESLCVTACRLGCLRLGASDAGHGGGDQGEGQHDSDQAVLHRSASLAHLMCPFG